MTDIEIANSVQLRPIAEVAQEAGFDEETVELYGRYKAKIAAGECVPTGKLCLVTAINPTSLGEGKTTVAIGLTDGLRRIGCKVMAALREPSLGPVFGLKGGATGGGWAQVAPMEDINLHFNGDLHAITAANNLLAAMVDNHIFQGNERRIHPGKVLWRRCLDVNDRNLRSIVTGLGEEKNGLTMSSGFDITAASEVMAILCLSENLADLKERLGNITVAYDVDGNPVYARDIHAEGAMAALLKEAVKPNLVQTLEGTPVLIHGGPFANIAHGCNSVIATKTALAHADYVVTEAGFGADLGAEKFVDVKCRSAGLSPSCIVLVATVKALKLAGGADKNALKEENFEALEKGLCNLGKHIENITGIFDVPCVVAINRYATDTGAELETVASFCQDYDVPAVSCDVWAKGGEGAEELAETVRDLMDGCDRKVRYTYPLEASAKEKIEAVVTRVYGGRGVIYTKKAEEDLRRIEKEGCGELPVIIAKTQYSLSDNPALLGRPENFEVTIREVKPRTGAGFLVAVAGNMVLMPGLPKVPAADHIDIDEQGNITGIF